MSAKRVVKKSASASKKPQRKPRVVQDALPNPDAMEKVIEGGGATGKEPKAGKVAKVLNLILSIGDDDRDRTYEEMIEWVNKQLASTKHGKPGVHVTTTGGYYILDGKVCVPEDYDKKRQRFKKGAAPPTWAGGPNRSTALVKASHHQQMDWDLANLSSDEYDKKYKIGKYKPNVISEAENNARQKERWEKLKREKIQKEEEAIEEFDIEDDELMGQIADESASKAIKRLKSSKRVVVKKKPVAKKKSVRIKK